MTDPSAEAIPERIHSEAAAWIVRGQSDDPQVRRRLSDWLDADPRHRLAYETIANTWGDSLGLADRAVARDRKLVRAPIYMRRSTHFAAAAASVVILVCASTAWLTSQGPLATLVSPAEARTYATAVGELKTIKLADGSSITLDTSSQVKVISGASYKLELKQGRVRVRPANQSRSFALLSNGAAATLRGGAFDVFVIDEIPTVTAVTTPLAIEVAREGGGRIERRLGPGEVADMRSGGALAHARNADIQWVDGMVALDGTPVASAIAAINRYNQVKIRLAEPVLASRSVTGAFRARDSLGFARAVAKMFDLRLTRPSHDEIVLLPDG